MLKQTIKSNDKIVNDPSEICFSRHFSTRTLSTRSDSILDVVQPSYTNSSFRITPAIVQQVIDADPDGLEIKFWKIATYVLAYPLYPAVILLCFCEMLFSIHWYLCLICTEEAGC